MSKSIAIRIDDELKQQAEKTLDEIGLNMTTYVIASLKALVREQGVPFELKTLNRGFPFDVKLLSAQPLDISMLTEDEFHLELEKGFSDIESGDVLPAKEAFSSLRKELGI